MCKFTDMTQKLEITLGPDTGDLKMRCGLHSGQVTAGCLRGERSRFQLFGDTVNTASRMETTSRVSHIQISNTTAELLRKEGKGKWVKAREDKVAVKGKGMMQTCWLKLRRPIRKKKVVMKEDREDLLDFSGKAIGDMDMVHRDEKGDNSDNSDEDDDYDNRLPEMSNQLSKKQRLIEWNVDSLSKLLQQMVACRPEGHIPEDLSYLENTFGKHNIALDEFENIVTLPKIGPHQLMERRDPNEIILPYEVLGQLREYVSRIADMYLDNPFHNVSCHREHFGFMLRHHFRSILQRAHHLTFASILS